MKDTTARAVATVGASAGCVAIAFAAPVVSGLAIAGIMLTVWQIWGRPKW